jgi:pimeloyl-ACP methyl ester carboxylesterase
MPDATAVPATVAPAFIAAAADDFLASFSFNIYNAWHAAGATAELHILENGGHNFGLLHQGKSSDQWSGLFDHWLAAHGFETTPTAK